MTNGLEVRLGDCIIAESIETCVDGIVIELHNDDTFTLLDFDTDEPIWVNANVVDWSVYERRNDAMSRATLS